MTQALSLSDALPLLSGDGFDVAVIGPGFANQTGFTEAQVLLHQNAATTTVCVVDGLTTDSLRQAMKLGFAHVLGAPLDTPKVDALLSIASSEGDHRQGEGA